MAIPKEILEKAFPDSDRPLLSYGLPHHEACRKHVDETFKASRVYIICSRTLAKTTTALADLQHALAPKVVGLRVGMSAPTLLQECLEVMQDVRRVKADIIVTIGGGSLTDAGKIVTYVGGPFGIRPLSVFIAHRIRLSRMTWRPKNSC